MKEIDAKEDLWGYGKRLRFVNETIKTAYPGREYVDIRILDVGCGSGTQLGIPLARLGYQLTGVDDHEPSIAAAKEGTKEIANARFLCGAVEDLPDGKFDVVILSEVLEHVADPEKLLRASVKYLEPDGIVIVTVPNGFGEFEWDSWAFRHLGLERLVNIYINRQSARNAIRTLESSTENVENRHIQFFRRRRLNEIFRHCGLTVIDERGSTLASGPFAGHILARFPGFINWNARVADRLPLSLASGWYFALRPAAELKR